MPTQTRLEIVIDDDKARRPAPLELTGRQMLEIARGQRPEPQISYTVDTRDLTLEEYRELIDHARVHYRPRGR